MVFADSRRALGDFSSRRYKQIEREGMSCPEYVAPAGWLSSRSSPARRSSQLARRKPNRRARAAPDGVQTGTGSDQGGQLFDAQGHIGQEILTNFGGCFTAPIRTTAEMVQKAQLQEEQ